MSKKRIHDFQLIVPDGDEILIVDDPDGSGGYNVKGVLVSALASIVGGGGSSDDITNQSNVSGATVSDALDQLLTDLANHVHTVSDITDFNAGVQAIVDTVIDSAPGALDTLNELAAALGDDPNFATTITASLAQKIDISEKGVANGVATLDTNGFVPWSELDISYDNTIVVSQGPRGDYSSIKDAVDAANANGSATPQAVLVYPGIYTEAPIVVNSNITVIAVGEATVIASDANTPLFSLDTGSLIRKFTIQGPTNSACVVPVSGAFNPVAENCVFSSGDCAGFSDDPTSSLLVTFSRFSSGLNKSLQVENGSRLSSTGCFDISGGGMFANGGILSISSTRIDNASIALHADNGGQILGQSIKINNPGIGIQTGANDSTNNIIDISAVEIFGSTNLDINQLGVGSSISIGGGFAKQARIEAVDWSNIRFYFLDTSTNDDSMEILSKLNVGSPEKPSTSSFGQGGSYSLGMRVFTSINNTVNDDGDTFVDVTSIAASRDSNTFAPQNGITGSAILIGSTRMTDGSFSKFWGIEIWQANGMSYNDYTDFSFQIWDGAQWVDINILASEATQFFNYGKEALIRANSHENIRFGITDQTIWATKTVNGVEGYWVKIVRDGGNGNIPSFETFKLHGSHMEVNELGKISFFGRARPRVTLSSGGNIFGESGGVSNITTSVGSGEPVGTVNPPTVWSHSIKNSNLNGNGDAIYYQFAIPRGADTSMPVTIRYNYAVTNTGATDSTVYVGFHPVEVAGVEVADTAGGIQPIPRVLIGQTERKTDNPAQTATAQFILTTSNNLQSFEVGPFDISNHYEGDIVFIRLELDVALDAMAVLTQEVVYYVQNLGARD